MDKIKKNRIFSFTVISLVYVLATVFGIAVYRTLSLPWWLSLLIADVAATVLVFIFSVLFDNASVYDPYWSVQPPVIIAAFAVSEGLGALGILLLAVVSAWGIRLTANWAYTFGDLSHQDWRYTMLAEKTGVFYPIVNFIGIHMVPTLVVWGCVLPVVHAIRTDAPVTVPSVIFICIALVAVVMQGVADFQMHSFRKNRDAAFIRRGLWKYSRHPNYLGEITLWWCVALAVICSTPEAWYLCAGALANALLFLFVSIPMADKRQSRKAGFAEYKSQTRMLLPIKK